jgi:hypothetical protein
MSQKNNMPTASHYSSSNSAACTEIARLAIGRLAADKPFRLAKSQRLYLLYRQSRGMFPQTHAAACLQPPR